MYINKRFGYVELTNAKPMWTTIYKAETKPVLITAGLPVSHQLPASTPATLTTLSVAFLRKVNNH